MVLCTHNSRLRPFNFAHASLIDWPRLRLLDEELEEFDVLLVLVEEDDVEELEVLLTELDDSELVDDVDDEEVPSSAKTGIAESARAATREQDAIRRIREVGKGNLCSLLFMARPAHCARRLPVE